MFSSCRMIKWWSWLRRKIKRAIVISYLWWRRRLTSGYWLISLTIKNWMRSMLRWSTWSCKSIIIDCWMIIMTWYLISSSSYVDILWIVITWIMFLRERTMSFMVWVIIALFVKILLFKKRFPFIKRWFSWSLMNRSSFAVRRT